MQSMGPIRSVEFECQIFKKDKLECVVRGKEHVVGKGHSITEAGRDFIATKVFARTEIGGTQQGMQFIALGSADDAFASADNALGGEYPDWRLYASYEHPAGSAYTRIYNTFRSTQDCQLRECAVFGTPDFNVGTMLARQLLSTVQNLASADSIRTIWTFNH